MVSLKEHNNLVEKLMKEIDAKDNQISKLTKQIHKGPNQSPQLQPSISQQILNKKITQLNKEHKQRISTLTQQIRSKSNENKDLKERLVIQKNIEAKQKSHVSEMFKKNFDRKPSTPHDYKVAALITHYEEELAKKATYIKNLNKEIVSLRECVGEIENRPINLQENVQQEELPRKHAIQLHIHQKEIGKIQNEVSKYRRLLQDKNKENKDISKKYEELTKQYYLILNEYSDAPKKLLKKPINRFMMASQSNRTTVMGNLLHEVCADQQNESEPSELSYSFQSNLAKISTNSTQKISSMTNLDQGMNLRGNDNAEDDGELGKIADILGVQHRQEIAPYILQIQAKMSSLQTYDLITRSAQEFLGKLGMGKVPLSQIPEKLQESMKKFQNTLDSADLLDELCIEAGAKKSKLADRISDLKTTQQEYFKNMKNLKFVKALPKANKVMEFLEYFQLSEEDISLPEQLKKIYEQLKYLNRFMKQADQILDREASGIESTLEAVLRYLEKSKSYLMEIRMQKANSKQKQG